MQIKIKTLAGSTIKLDFDTDSTIGAVKAKLQEKVGAAVSQTRLIFNGKQVADEKTLEDLNIKAGNTLHMVLALRG